MPRAHRLFRDPFARVPFARAPFVAAACLAACLAIVSPLVLRPALAEGDGLDALVELIGSVDDDERLQLDLLKGVHEALRGRRRASPPPSWARTYGRLQKSKSSAVRREAATLALIFQDPRARGQLLRLASDEQAELAERRWAVATLVEHRAEGLEPLLQRLLDTPALRVEALKGLARYAAPDTPPKVLALYPKLDAVQRQLALGALSSRPEFAAELLAAIRRGVVPARDLSSFHARQIRAFEKPTLNRALDELWGTVSTTGAEGRRLIQRWKGRLNERVLKRGDVEQGRVVFQRVCGSCHRLYGKGGDIGPDLTGSNRDNLDYVLENVLAPSAAVARDYRLTQIRTRDGEVLSGLARRRSNQVIQLQTPTEKRLIPLKDIEEQRTLPISMMPEGLFDKLKFDEVRDLVLFLKTKPS